MSAAAVPACTGEQHQVESMIIDHGRVGALCLVLGADCQCGAQRIRLTFTHSEAADFHAELGAALAVPHETEPRAHP